MKTEPNQVEEAPLPFIEAFIKGNIDADGFFKITTGAASESHWSILVHHTSLGKVSKLTINPDYEHLGALQTIELKPTGTWKEGKDAPLRTIPELFQVLKDDKPTTVSPTTAYKILGITK